MKSKGIVVKRILFWVVTLLVLAGILFPLLWIYLTAFKSSNDIFAGTLQRQLIFTPTLENFKRLFVQFPFFRSMGNSLIISITSTVLVMVIALPAAYSFARWNTGGGHILFNTIASRMFPGAVAAIPFFLMLEI